jgi:hypothetical protein
MSDAREFLQKWVRKNIKADTAAVHNDTLTAGRLAEECLWETQGEDLSEAEVTDAAGGNLLAFMISRSGARISRARLPKKPFPEVCGSIFVATNTKAPVGQPFRVAFAALGHRNDVLGEDCSASRGIIWCSHGALLCCQSGINLPDAKRVLAGPEHAKADIRFRDQHLKDALDDAWRRLPIPL